ncbi:hypothetical protein HQ520_13015 [bacterium]|nr:hypothetical protein [bacterium]
MAKSKPAGRRKRPAQWGEGIRPATPSLAASVPSRPYREMVRDWMAIATAPRIFLALVALSLVLLVIAYGVKRREIAGVFAERALAKGNYAGAVEHLQARFGEIPTRPDRNLLLARGFLQLDQPEKALEQLNAAKKRENLMRPQEKGLYFGLLAQTRLEMDQDPEALQAAREALELDPDEPWASAVLADLLLRRNEALQAARFVDNLPEDNAEFQKLREDYRHQLEQSVLDVPEAELSEIPEKVEKPDLGPDAF